MTQAEEGRLFRLRLERSKAAREDALASVRPVPGGWWQARIGGRMRGRTRRFVSRAAAVAAVQAHYNAALLRFVEQRKGRA